MRLGRSIVVGSLLSVATASPHSYAAPAGKLVVLAGGSRILIVDVASKTILVDSQFAPDFTSTWGSPGVSADQRTAYAPLWRTGTREVQILAVGSTSSSLRRVGTAESVDGLPWLDVGQRSGHLYLISGSGDDVRVFDPASGASISRMVVRGTAQPARTDSYAAAISTDERRLYVSYHGTHTTGIDWFAFTDSTLVPCAATSIDVRRVGCIGAHGFFTTQGNRLMVDLSGNHGLREVDSIGREFNTFDVGLPGNHMVVWAVDTAGAVAYSLGDCGYTGGLSATPLRAGSTPAAFPASRICGTIIRLSPDRSWLAIPSHNLGVLTPNSVTIVDCQTGQVLETIPLPYTIENLIAIR